MIQNDAESWNNREVDDVQPLGRNIQGHQERNKKQIQTKLVRWQTAVQVLFKGSQVINLRYAYQE